MLKDRQRRMVLKAMAGAAVAWPSVSWGKTSGLLTTFGAVLPGASIHKVFAAGPPAAVLLYCLAPQKMLGWPLTLPDAARQLLRPGYQNLPFLGRLAGRGSTVPLEDLLRLTPQLILDAGTVNETQRSAAQRVVRQTGIPYALVDGSLSHSAAQLRVVGQLLGEERRGEALAQYADQLLQSSAGITDAASLLARPSVYLARSADGLETGLGNSIHTESIVLAGGRNVAGHADTVGLGRLSMEQLLDWDPDMIVTQDLTFYRMASGSSLWRGLRAVREGRLYCAPVLPLGWIDGPPGVNRLLGVQWLQAMFQDRLYKTDLHEATQQFFGLFYGSSPDADTLTRLLAAPEL